MVGEPAWKGAFQTFLQRNAVVRAQQRRMLEPAYKSSIQTFLDRSAEVRAQQLRVLEPAYKSSIQTFLDRSAEVRAQQLRVLQPATKTLVESFLERNAVVRAQQRRMLEPAYKSSIQTFLDRSAEVRAQQLRVLQPATKTFAQIPPGADRANGYYRAQAVTSKSVLLGDQYRESTRTAVSKIIGSVTPDELIDDLIDEGHTEDIDAPLDAWAIIEETSPELAAAIEEQANSINVAWLAREAVRNTLAGLVVGLLFSVFYVVGLEALPPEFQNLFAVLVNNSDVSFRGAVKQADQMFDQRFPDQSSSDGA